MPAPASPPPAGHPVPLLLIAHGTRDPAAAGEMDRLVQLVGARTGGAVGHAWLEDFAEPDAVTAAQQLLAGGADRLVTLPLLQLAAGHAKNDVPAAVAAIRTRWPQVAVSHGAVLGLHPALAALARRRLDAVSPREGRREELLVVAASGSSDPDANADLAKAARFLAEGSGHRWVEVAFAAVTWPRTAEVLRRAAAAGVRRAVIFSWSLLPGLLERRVAEAARQVAAETGIVVALAGRFGPEPEVAEVIVERYAQALGHDVRANCDLCCYRVPLPGYGERVGAPSAGGTAAGPA